MKIQYIQNKLRNDDFQILHKAGTVFWEDSSGALFSRNEELGREHTGRNQQLRRDKIWVALD